jgi:3-deoxy-D-manno-octulosonic-acid transferase
MGRPGMPRPEGPVVWVHGASVGETLSTLPLIDRLIADLPGTAVLVTSGTVTSAELLAKRLPAGAFHQYMPLDHPAWTRRFLEHWRPDLVLWVESELWPNIISQCQARGVPMVLVNGRLSERSLRNWRWGRGLVRALLAGFDLRLAQTEGDRRRFEAVGGGPVQCLGNIKFAAPPLPVDEAELRSMEGLVGSRPVWLAASTHAGEEEKVADAHLYAKSHETELPRLPDLLTLLVPRHASRGAEIAALLRAKGISVALRSRNERLTPETDVYVADSMGELGLFYRLTEVAFIGGSLIPHGGHNPIEAAQLDCAIIHGPHMENFSEVTEALTRAGGAALVHNHPELMITAADLLGDDTRRRRMMRGARDAAAAETGVLDRIMAALAPYLPRTGGGASRARA